MDSDSLPAAPSSTISQFTPLGRRPAPSSISDESFVRVEIRHHTAQQQWRLAPAKSGRFALIYSLGWLPKRVQRACESTRTLPGHVLSVYISQADYRSIFHV